MNGTLAFLAWSEREATIKTTLDLTHLAVAQTVEHTDEVINNIDRILTGISDVLSVSPAPHAGGDLSVHRLLVRRHSTPQFVRALFVVSADGVLLYDSLSATPEPLNLSDRDYVRHHLDGGDDILFVGKPVISRANGQWIVPVSRRVEDRFGRLRAIIAAAFDPAAFVATLAQSPLPAGIRAVILAPDGNILGCLPAGNCLGQSATHWSVFVKDGVRGKIRAERKAAFVPGPTGPSAQGVSKAYGVTVAATIGTADALAAWFDRIRGFVALGLLSSAGILVGTGALYQQIRRRRKALEDLAEGNATLERRVAERTSELQQSEERLRAFISTARDAMLVIDGRGTILAFNPAAEELFGYRSGEIVGRSINMLMPTRYADHHDRHVQEPRHGVAPVGTNREMVGLHRNGTEFPIELTVGSTMSGAERIHVGVVRDIRQRKAQEQILQRLATTDGLTGVLNRRAFMEKAEALIETARRHGRPLTAIMIDADCFKSVNDNFGHAVGDKVLCALAQALTDSLRGSDLLGRFGGEEFAVLAPETDLTGARELAERLLEKVRSEEVAYDGGTLRFTVSIGVALLAGQTTVAELLREADNALYEAKAGGRDRAVIASLTPAL